MNPKRVFLVMVGVLVLLGGLTIAGVILGDNLLQHKSKQLIGLKADNRTLEAQQTSLVQAKKDIDKYSDLEKIAKAVVPQEKDQARTVREIVNIASASNVKIASITFPTSELGKVQPKATPSTESGDKNATPAPVVTVPPLTQVKPVDNIKGLYHLEITIQSDTNTPVPYSKLIEFLNRLEQNRRTAQVSGINIQPSAKSRDLVTFNLVLDVYIKP